MGFFDGSIKAARGLKTFTKGVFSEPDGTPSATRVLMGIFAGFSIWLIWRIFWHVFRITDSTQLTIWLSNIPLLITALMGLIALPYTINKGAGAISDTLGGLANMMAAAKQAQLNAKVEDKIETVVKKITKTDIDPGAPAPAASAPAATGSNGPKG